MITHSVDPSVRKNKAPWTLSDTAINRACRLLLQPWCGALYLWCVVEHCTCGVVCGVWWSTVLVRERQTRRRGGSNAILMLPRHQNKPHHRRWRSPRISCAALRAQARPQRHKSGNSVLLLIWFPCNCKHSWSGSGHSSAKQTLVVACSVWQCLYLRIPLSQGGKLSSGVIVCHNFFDCTIWKPVLNLEETRPIKKCHLYYDICCGGRDENQRRKRQGVVGEWKHLVCEGEEVQRWKRRKIFGAVDRSQSNEPTNWVNLEQSAFLNVRK